MQHTRYYSVFKFPPIKNLVHCFWSKTHSNFQDLAKHCYIFQETSIWLASTPVLDTPFSPLKSPEHNLHCLHFFEHLGLLISHQKDLLTSACVMFFLTGNSEFFHIPQEHILKVLGSHIIRFSPANALFLSANILY